MLIIYTFVLRILRLASLALQPFSIKHRKWWSGRRNQTIKEFKPPKPIWIHCASLGEFEQGRPIMESIRQMAPGVPIVLTFFSPSGFEVRKNYPGADAIYYLPIDLPRQVNKFISSINPRLAIFIKYEFWFNYLKALRSSDIPFLYVSVLVRPNNLFLKPALRSLSNIIGEADQIFTQNRSTQTLLEGLNFENLTLGGDTRVDRVLQIAQSPKKFNKVAEHCQGKQVFVYGSVWPSDLHVLKSFVLENGSASNLHIIAPHQVEGNFMNELISEMGPRLEVLSKLEASERVPRIILVDTMGDLADLYQFASLAYVGGGFGSGIHSILEPAAHCKPLIFGPKHAHFAEAQIFIESQAAKCVRTSNDFEAAVDFYQSGQNYDAAQVALQSYLEENQGATSKIIDYLTEQNWLT